MQQLPTYAPGSGSAYVLCSGMFLGNAGRDEIVTVTLYNYQQMGSGYLFDSSGLGIVAQIVPLFDYDYECNEGSSGVGGTDQPNYTLYPPNGVTTIGDQDVTAYPYPATFGVLNFTLTIGGAACLVTFSNPADPATMVAQINAAIKAQFGSMVATAYLSGLPFGGLGLMVTTLSGAVTFTDGTFAVDLFGFVSGMANANTPSNLTFPFYAVDLPRIYCPFNCEIWICGGVAMPSLPPISVASLKRRANKGDRKTNTLTFYCSPPANPNYITVPKGATGIFSPNPVLVGLSDNDWFGSGKPPAYTFVTSESGSPTSLAGFPVVVPQVDGPLGFVIEM